MEPLFTTQSAYTLEEFKKYNAKLLSGRRILLLVLMSFLLVLVSLMAVMATRNIAYVYMLPLWLIIVWVLLPILQKSSVKKAYYLNKALQKNIVHTFSFFNEHFEVKTNNSFSSIEYSDIFKILESKTNFYIMGSVNQAHLIVKSNCSPELIEFIKNLKQK